MAINDTLDLAMVQIECDQSLQRMERLFVPEIKLTLVVRHPGRTDGESDMLFTRDEIPAVIACIERLALRDPSGMKPGPF